MLLSEGSSCVLPSATELVPIVNYTLQDVYVGKCTLICALIVWMLCSCSTRINAIQARCYFFLPCVFFRVIILGIIPKKQRFQGFSCDLNCYWCCIFSCAMVNKKIKLYQVKHFQMFRRVHFNMLVYTSILALVSSTLNISVSRNYGLASFDMWNMHCRLQWFPLTSRTKSWHILGRNTAIVVWAQFMWYNGIKVVLVCRPYNCLRINIMLTTRKHVEA